MSTADIDTIVAAFAASAHVAQRAGFDAVEIHGAHGYLVDEFLWAATNHRRDGYGGTYRDRTRFAVEVVRAVRAATSPDFPVLFRFSQFKERHYPARLATTPARLAEVLTPLAEAGVSVLHASTRRWWQPEFLGSPLNLAGWAKHVTGLPTITVGSVGLAPGATTADLGRPDSLQALAARSSPTPPGSTRSPADEQQSSSTTARSKRTSSGDARPDPRRAGMERARPAAMDRA